MLGRAARKVNAPQNAGFDFGPGSRVPGITLPTTTSSLAIFIMPTATAFRKTAAGITQISPRRSAPAGYAQVANEAITGAPSPNAELECSYSYGVGLGLGVVLERAQLAVEVPILCKC
jgi:hypothetical protein